MKKCFTLMELLIVMGVIAILASMLLPALNKAREEVKMVVCRSNLHQNSLGLMMYAEDNNSWGPQGWFESVMFEPAGLLESYYYPSVKTTHLKVHQCAGWKYNGAGDYKLTLNSTAFSSTYGHTFGTPKRPYWKGSTYYGDWFGWNVTNSKAAPLPNLNAIGRSQTYVHPLYGGSPRTITFKQASIIPLSGCMSGIPAAYTIGTGISNLSSKKMPHYGVGSNTVYADGSAKKIPFLRLAKRCFTVAVETDFSY